MSSHVSSTIMPLGMARLVSARLTKALDHELPRGEVPEDKPPLVETPRRHPNRPPVADGPPPSVEADASAPRVRVHVFRCSPAGRTPRPLLVNHDRVPGSCIEYLEAHAPEPHVVRCRLAFARDSPSRSSTVSKTWGPRPSF